MSNDKNNHEEETAEKNNGQSTEKETDQATKSKAEKASSEDQNNQPETDKEVSEAEVLQEELDKQKDKYMRLFAEFENFKRRTSKERVEMYKTAGQEVMSAMLPVLDDFDRAIKEIKKSADEGLLEGVELINSKLRETLNKQGLEEMNIKEGDKFDADLHDAVTQIPAPKKKLKGKIVDVIEKGYTLGDKIIRFPKVVTGK